MAKSRRSVGWIIVAGMLLLAVGYAAILARRSPDSLASRVKLGSRLSRLPSALELSQFDSVHVWEYRDVISGDATTEVNTPFGSFYARSLGTWKSFSSAASNRELFTGEVKCYYHFLWSLVSIRFVYRDGRLFSKDWGEVVG